MRIVDQRETGIETGNQREQEREKERERDEREDGFDIRIRLYATPT